MKTYNKDNFFDILQFDMPTKDWRKKFIIYQENELVDAYKKICELTNTNFIPEDLDLVQEWLKSNKSLDNFYEGHGCSKGCECYYLNDKIVVKTGMKIFLAELFQHINEDIFDYVVPTVIILLDRSHFISKAHQDFVIKYCQDMEFIFTVDCLIFQPKVELLKKYGLHEEYKNREEFKSWLRKTNIKNTTKDLNEFNVGYIDNKPVIFDW